MQRTLTRPLPAGEGKNAFLQAVMGEGFELRDLYPLPISCSLNLFLALYRRERAQQPALRSLSF